MATDTPSAPDSPLAARSVEQERFIERQLRDTRLRVQWVDLLTVGLGFFVATGVYLTLLVMADHWLVEGGWSPLARFVGFGLLVAGLAIGSLVWLLPRAWKRIHPLFAAEQIERVQPGLKNSLINFLQLRSRQTDLPPAVLEAVERRAAEDLARSPLENAVDRTPLLKLLYGLAALVVLLAVYKVASPKDPLRSLGRVLAPWAKIAPPTRVQIDQVEPGTTQSLMDTRVAVQARISGARPQENIVVEYSTLDGQVVGERVTMTPASDPKLYRAELPHAHGGLLQDIRYRILAGDARSDDFEIEVLDVPTIVVEQVEYQYPSYTGLPPRIVEKQGDLKALAGTTVNLRARANDAIKHAALDFGRDGTRDLPLSISGRDASVAFTLRLKPKTLEAEHSRYQLLFTNQAGYDNPRPIEHRIEVIADLPPEVAWLAPTGDPAIEQKLALNDRLLMHVQGHDPDFQLADLSIIVERSGKTIHRHKLLDEPRGGSVEGRWTLEPRGLKLQPGELIHYFAEGVDNRQPDPNRVRSAKFAVRIVSPDPAKEDQLAQNEPRKDPPQNDDRKPPEQQPPAANGAQQPDPAKQPPQPGEQPPRGEQGQGGSKPGEKTQDQPAQKPGEQPAPREPNGANPPQPPQPENREKPNDGQPQAGGGQGEGDQSKTDKPAGETGNQGNPNPGQPMPGEAGRNQPGEAKPPENGSSTGGEPQGEQRSPQNPQGDREGASPQQNSPDQQQPGGEPASPPKRVDPDADPGKAIEEINRHFDQRPGESGGTPTGEQRPNSGEKQPSAGERGTTQQPLGQQPMGEKSPSQPGEQPQPGDKPNADGTGEKTPDPGQPAPQPGERTGAGDKAPAGSPADQGTPMPKPAPTPGEQPMGGESQLPKGTPGAGQNSGDTRGSPMPQEASQARDKTPQDQPGEQDSNSKPDANSPSRSKRESDSQGDTSGDQSGGGKDGGGQRANKPGTGGAGSNTAAEQGGSQTEGQGEGPASNKGGDQAQAQQPTPGGKSSNEAGPGSKTQPGSTKPDGNEQGTPSDNSNANSDPAGKPPSDGTQPPAGPMDPAQAGKSGQSGESSKDGNPPPGGSRRDNPTGGGAPSPNENAPGSYTGREPGGDDPNLDYARRATELAVERLRDQLKKGDVDPELLKKLQWSKDDAERFVRRWDELRQTAREPNRDGQVSSELDDALRSLGLRPRGTSLTGDKARADEQRPLRDTRRTKPPSEYADQYRAYSTGTNQAEPKK